MKKLKLDFTEEIPFDELVDELVTYHDHADLITFIKMIDEKQGDRSFTIKLADYFDEQRKEFAKEELTDG